MKRERNGRIYADDNLVIRIKYDDGSRVSKLKAPTDLLSADELMAYLRENDHRLAESRCIGLIMRNRGLSMLDAAKILNLARYSETEKPEPIKSKAMKRLRSAIAKLRRT